MPTGILPGMSQGFLPRTLQKFLRGFSLNFLQGFLQELLKGFLNVLIYSSRHYWWILADIVRGFSDGFPMESWQDHKQCSGNILSKPRFLPSLSRNLAKSRHISRCFPGKVFVRFLIISLRIFNNISQPSLKNFQWNWFLGIHFYYLFECFNNEHVQYFWRLQ